MRNEKGLACAVACWLVAVTVVGCSTTTLRGAGKNHGPAVMGWVPAYAVPESMQALASDPAIGRGLTRIGLQFWNPSRDGRGLVLAPINASGTPLDAAAITRVRDWAHQRGIKVLLTVYNNSETTKTWDWDLARRAFNIHRAEFTQALVSTVRTYRLDGVDVDLEGNGDFDADRQAYADFITGLSAALRAEGKLLTVDSFHSPCYNAPNMAWWSDWAGHIDAVHSMGYADLYEGSEETFTPTGGPVCERGAHIFKYSWQLAWGRKAGYRADQILMGLPTWVDHWGQGGMGSDAASHIREVQALGAGIALWDLQLSAPGWRRANTWRAVRALRDQPGPDSRAEAASPATTIHRAPADQVESHSR